MVRDFNEMELLARIPEDMVYENQTISNDFIFGKVMQDKGLCTELLELLTGNKLDEDITINAQKFIKVTNDSRGVRYDVYVEDGKNTVYDAEMQNKNVDMPKRARYYSGMVDLNLLESGGSYKDLKNCYIMFICTFDPFGKGLCCYEFENYSIKDEMFSLEDGRKILIFNTKGKYINVPDKVKEFLDYIETKKSTNAFTDKIDIAVNKARQNKEWRLEYMKTLLHDMDVRLEGEEIGREKGRIELLVSQIVKKIKKGKTFDIIAQELEEDVEYIEKIYNIAIMDEVDCDVDKIIHKLQK